MVGVIPRCGELHQHNNNNMIKQKQHCKYRIKTIYENRKTSDVAGKWKF